MKRRHSCKNFGSSFCLISRQLDRTSRKPNSKPGNHIDSIDTADFKRLVKESMSVDFDVTLEIEDKEKDALKAVKSLLNDRHFVKKRAISKRQGAF
jgi:hypothetical protein